LIKNWILGSIFLIAFASVVIVLGLVFFDSFFSPSYGMATYLDSSAPDVMGGSGSAQYVKYHASLDDEAWFYGLILVIVMGVIWLLFLLYSIYGSVRYEE
jgi:hypothetical protein